MPQTRSVGIKAKQIVVDFLKNNNGEGRSSEIKQALEEAEYSYPTSVVMNDLIEDGYADKDENGVYYLTDEGLNFRDDQESNNQGSGNRSHQNSGRTSSRSRTRDDAGDSDNRGGQGRSGQSTNVGELLDCLSRLREINREEKDLIYAVQNHPLIQMIMQVGEQSRQGQSRTQGQSQGRRQGRQGSGRQSSTQRDQDDDDDDTGRHRNSSGQFTSDDD